MSFSNPEIIGQSAVCVYPYLITNTTIKKVENGSVSCETTIADYLFPYDFIFYILCSLFNSTLLFLAYNRKNLLRSNKSTNQTNYDEKYRMFHSLFISLVLTLIGYNLDPWGVHNVLPYKLTEFYSSTGISALFGFDAARIQTYIWITIISNGILSVKVLLKVRKVLHHTSSLIFMILTPFNFLLLLGPPTTYRLAQGVKVVLLGSASVFILSVSGGCAVYVVHRLQKAQTSRRKINEAGDSSTSSANRNEIQPIVKRLCLLTVLIMILVYVVFVISARKYIFVHPSKKVYEVQSPVDIGILLWLLNQNKYPLLININGAVILYNFWAINVFKKSSVAGGRISKAPVSRRRIKQIRPASHVKPMKSKRSERDSTGPPPTIGLPTKAVSILSPQTN